VALSREPDHHNGLPKFLKRDEHLISLAYGAPQIPFAVDKEQGVSTFLTYMMGDLDK
jgi:hypothetical protein